MSITLAGSSGALTAAGGTTMTLGSASPTTGQLILARFSAPLGGLAVTIPPSGWSHLPNDTLGKQVVWWRVAGGAEPVDYTFTFNYASVAGREFQGVLTVWDGTAGTSPIPDSEVATGSGVSPTCPSATTVRDGSVIYVAVLSDATILATPSTVNVFTASPGRADGVETVAVRGAVGSRVFTTSGRAAWSGGFPGGGSSPAWAALTIVLQPAAAAPYTPVLLSPANGAYLDAAAGFTATWTFSDPDDGDTQAKYALRRKAGIGGTYEYWKAATSSWQSSSIYNTSSTAAATFPAAAWANATTYLWSVSTQDQTGANSPFAADSVLVGSSAPTLAVTAPTGTITNSTSPTVTWTFTDTDGDPQQQWRAKIFTNATVIGAGFDPDFSAAVADSGLMTTTASSWIPPVDLDNSASYWAYVTASQPGGQSTGWVASAFTLNVTPPAVPTSVTLTADNTLARVLVQIVGPTDASILLQRSDDGGTTWTTVRDASSLAPDVSGHSSVYDYAAPLNVVLKYRARSVKGAGAGGQIASAWTASSTTTLTVPEWQLKHPSDHTNDTAIDVPSPFSAGREETMGVFAGLSSVNPIVVRDVIRSATVSFGLEVIDPAVKAKVVALRESQSTLLLQSPFLGEQWWIDVTKFDDPLVYADGTGYLWQISVEAAEVAEP